MTDIRIEKLADLLVDYSTAVRPGDKVVITGEAIAEPLLKAIYKHVLRAGGHPTMMVDLPGFDEVFFRSASVEQLQHVPEPFKLIMETYDVRIAIIAEENTKTLSGIDPAKILLCNQARMETMQTFMRRSAAGEVRWTVAAFPTNARAQEAEMSLTEYEDFVYGACLPDMEDPIGYWRRFSTWQQEIVEWLRDKEKVRIVGPGTDLRFSIVGRVFDNEDGHWNMPGGETGTGPVEDSVEGHIEFSYPSNYMGREVGGVALEFKRGQVVKATADKNEDSLLKALDTDEGARHIGEFAIGTNEGIQRFTGNILFDEKMQGTVHLALGAGFPWTGSQNQSAIHWDLICDLRNGGAIWVDDELLYESGRFVYK